MGQTSVRRLRRARVSGRQPVPNVHLRVQLRRRPAGPELDSQFLHRRDGPGGQRVRSASIFHLGDHYSVTRLGDLLNFGQLLNAFGNT